MKRTAFALGAILSSAMFMACVAENGPMIPGGGGGGGGGESVVGNFRATQWVTTSGSGQTDQILAGSTLTITLNSNGSTTGHMHLVASANNPALEADMTGTWSGNATTVNFSQSADTFVRNMPFSVVANGSKWELKGDQDFQGTRIQLTLTQL